MVVKKRIVQPFTREALRSDTKVLPPPKLKLSPTYVQSSAAFRAILTEENLPSKLSMVCQAKNRNPQFPSKCQKSLWDSNFYLQYLPIFFDGLRDSDSSIRKLAEDGLKTLVDITGPKIFTVIPSLIVPIKRALRTRKQEVIVATLRAIQRIVKKAPCTGEVLIRHYREFLPQLNIYCCSKGTSISDKIDEIPTIDEVIYATLRTLERCSSDQRLAYITIKHMIPTYESGFFNI